MSGWEPVRPLIPTTVTPDLVTLDKVTHRLNAFLGEKWTPAEGKNGRSVSLVSKGEDVEIVRAAVAGFAAAGWRVEIDEVNKIATFFLFPATL